MLQGLIVNSFLGVSSADFWSITLEVASHNNRNSGIVVFHNGSTREMRPWLSTLVIILPIGMVISGPSGSLQVGLNAGKFF